MASLDNGKKQEHGYSEIMKPFFCKTNHSDAFIYSQVGMTIVFSIAGLVLILTKQWKLALVLAAASAFTGISAYTNLQSRLNTDSCDNTKFRALYATSTVFTLVSLIAWVFLSLHMLGIDLDIRHFIDARRNKGGSSQNKS